VSAAVGLVGGACEAVEVGAGHLIDNARGHGGGSREPRKAVGVRPN